MELSQTISDLPRLLPYLTPSERALVDQILQRPTKWEPQEGPQTAAYYSTADITGYGGAAGGGKTDLILGLAHQQHFRSIIFRREFKQLKGIIDRSREMFGPLDASYRGSPVADWQFADGRSIELGSVQHAGDETNYQGQPHDLIALDEVTEFLLLQVRFLLGWLRSAKGRRCRAIMTFNPPTNAEGQWVIEFFGPWLQEKHPNPALPGELRWYMVDDQGKDVEVSADTIWIVDHEEVRPQSRTFIPARLSDNAYLKNTGYRNVLAAMPEPLRSQMLLGDFKAGITDDPWQLIPTAWIKAAQARWTPTRPFVKLSAIGVDVARGGRDKTVLTPRYGRWFDKQIVRPGSETPDGQAVIAEVIKLAPAKGVPINIDVIGVGTSPVDVGRMMGLNVVGMNGSAASEGHDRSGQLEFVNFRAAMWWGLREALEPGFNEGSELAIPPDPEILADLASAKWMLKTNGIQVESKDDIIKRIGRSPDKGESIVYAAATGPQTMNITDRMLHLSAQG